MSRVQSIERAFAVLGALAAGPIGVTEVAVRAALPKSTAARLLASLASEEVVEQVPGETRWRLGPRIVTLAASVRPTRSLVALARPHLTELAETTGEAAGLSIPDGFTVHYVDQVESQHPVGVRDWTGTRLPMHAVSAGLVFLAHMHPAELERFLDRPLERVTERTVVERTRLGERLRAVQLAGVAWT
ncbi:MAG TPA: IclR family transcriptional regulator, partial [Vitreimonas sp.]|nr:IclR family transcriptional regulator [Vitreimonas sp.]